MYNVSVHLGFVWVEKGLMGSEVEQIDEILRGEGHGAVFWVVGCAGMILKTR